MDDMTAASARNRFSRRWAVAGPSIVVGVVAVVVGVTGIRGSDYPAHVFRATEWRANPLGTWNFQWYGGHSTFSYSILAPPASVVLSTFGLCALCGVVSVVLAGWLMSRYASPAATLAGASTLALFEIDNLIVGRVPFALGYLLLLVTLVLWEQRRTTMAAIVATTVALASPVAGVMLLLITGPIVIDRAITNRHSLHDALRSSRHAVAISAAAAAPLLAMTALTSRNHTDAGYFPYIAINLAYSLIAAALVLVTARRRVVRIAAATALTVTAIVALVPNPLGGNLSRYTTFVIVPVAATLAVARWQRLRRDGRATIDRSTSTGTARREGATATGAATRHGGVYLIVTVVLWASAVGYATSFTMRNIGRWARDPSRELVYYEPLLDQVNSWQAGTGLTRLEIAFTKDHWEAALVAPRVPYARGWERQVDLERNAVLYDDGLTADEYRQWIDDSAVGLVAVPDVRLDQGGRPEAHLIDDGVDWLTLVWQNEHWRLYAVAQPSAPAEGGTVERIDANGIVIDVAVPGTVTIDAVYDRRLGIAPSGCVRADPSGRVVAEVERPGTYRIIERRWAFLTGSRATCDAG